MKTYSKVQLTEQAKDIFEQYPLAQKLYATTDGQFFLQENRAEMHKKDKKLSVVTIEKPLSVENSNTSDSENEDVYEFTLLGYKELLNWISKTENKAELKLALDAEKKREKPRKTVITAIEGRIAELQNEGTGEGSESDSEEEEKPSEDVKGQAIDETKLLETIAKMDSVDGLKQIEEKETATETPRQTILDAVQARITDLNKD